MAMSPRLLRPLASGFNPKSIANLGLWLDASNTSSLTFNATTVSEWRDLSGNGRHFAQETAAAQPGTSTLNGRRVLTGTQSNTLMAGNSAALTIARNVPAVTVFAVAQMDAQPFQSIFVASRGGATTARVLLGRNNSETVIGGRRLDADSFAQVVYAGVTTPQVYTGVLDYANSDAFLYGSGALTASSTSFQTDGNTSDTSSNAVSLFAAHSVLVNHLVGSIAEIIVYQRALSATERQRVERYLGRKWGITVA